MAAKLKAADIIENWPNRLEYTGLEKMLMAVSIALLAVTARVPCSFWPVWMWRAPC